MKTFSFGLLLKRFRMNRFQVLLPITLMVVIVPAFLPNGLFSRLFFFSLLSALFIQSMLAVTELHSKKIIRRYLTVFFMIVIIWLEPQGQKILTYNVLRLTALIGFFGFIIYSLAKYLRKAKVINTDLIFITINIYLLMGILFGNLAMLIDLLLPGAYRFPEYMEPVSFSDFLYFSFITMSTVGYGDVLPVLSQSQAISYITALAGQLYIAIVMAIIVGKFLVHNNE